MADPFRPWLRHYSRRTPGLTAGDGQVAWFAARYLGSRAAGDLLGVVAEAVDEAAEDAALVGERRAFWRRLGALMAFWLVVVGAGDGVDDLGLVEGLRPGDLRDEAHQVAVEQDLGLQPGGVLGAPDGLAPVPGRHLDRVGVDAGLPQMRRDSAVAQRVGYPTGAVLIHDGQGTGPFRGRMPSLSWPDAVAFAAGCRRFRGGMPSLSWRDAAGFVARMPRNRAQAGMAPCRGNCLY